MSATLKPIGPLPIVISAAVAYAVFVAFHALIPAIAAGLFFGLVAEHIRKQEARRRRRLWVLLGAVGLTWLYALGFLTPV